MLDKPSNGHGNTLADSLPEEESSLIFASAERVSLTAREVIADSEAPIDHVYFPVTCVLSVLSVMPDGSAVETAVIGQEGMAPLTAFHGVPSSAEQVIVQVPGDALRLSRAHFDAILQGAPRLRESLHRFSQALFSFAAQASGCNRRHSVVQRCARWLLQTHDRVPGDEFPATHLFVSRMMGVRRSSVTLAAEALRAAGAVAYRRGNVRIVSRETLQAQSCDCYNIIRATYDRLLSGSSTEHASANRSLAKPEHRSAEADPTGNEGWEAERRTTRVTAEALKQFGEQLRDARIRSEELRDSLEGSAAGSNGNGSRVKEELILALEQLQVAEEELRVQMEALIEMRATLDEQQQKWRARIDTLPDAFVETDQHDTIVEVNRAAEALLGRARPYLVGKPLLALVPEAERRALRELITTLRRSGTYATWRGAFGAAHVPSRRVEASVSVAAPTPMTTGRTGPQSRIPFPGARWLFRVDATTERP